jgi:hypothetical protein
MYYLCYLAGCTWSPQLTLTSHRGPWQTQYFKSADLSTDTQTEVESGIHLLASIGITTVLASSHAAVNTETSQYSLRQPSHGPECRL